MKKKITEKVYSSDDSHWDDGDYLPDNLLEFQRWLSEKIASIPAEHIQNARVSIDASYEANVDFRIEYTRPETDEEIAEREEYAAALKEAEAAHERAEYLRLKDKFESRPNVDTELLPESDGLG